LLLLLNTILNFTASFNSAIKNINDQLGQWLIAAILATQEAEIRRIAV
jgi:hypothetical protein